MDSVVSSRYFGSVPKLGQRRSSFGGVRQHERMAQVRKYIETIRVDWLKDDTYKSMINTVKNFCTQQVLPVEVDAALTTLCDGFRDYADVVTSRPHHPEKFHALELYCTDEGYNYLFTLVSQALREETPSSELLLTATILIELVTIDLYNLRLSQVGDPRYSNFCGTTYRGMTVEVHELNEYREILGQPDLAQRGFAVPLALVSSSSDATVMHQFATKQHSLHNIPMLWQIHVHGLDPDLLRIYHHKYPESVVTSICAMPVGRVSAFSEKEILLRGISFQLIALEDVIIQGRRAVKVVLVACNANRDHTTETASSEGEKHSQRLTFMRIVQASKYEVCASIAEQYSAQDANTYRMLQKESIEAIKTADFSEAIENDFLADMRPEHTAVWLGGSKQESYSRTYVALRLQWQLAMRQGRWLEVERLLAQEYSWSRNEWFNLGELSEQGEQNDQSPNEHNRTLLHYLVLLEPAGPAEDPSYLAWERLVREAASDKVWKSVRSFDRHHQTAHDLAFGTGSAQLAKSLMPDKKHDVDASWLSQIELRLHMIMTQKVGQLLEKHAFLMPQMSILLEMTEPRLWIPVPAMYGGFLVELRKDAVQLTIFETQQGHIRPKLTKIEL